MNDPVAPLLPFLGPDERARGEVAAAVAATPGGSAGALALARVLERASDPAELLQALDGPGLPRALALLGLGRAPVEALMAEPEDLRVLGEELPPIDAAVEATDLDALRVMRRRATLALAAQELTGELPATRAAALLSVLADHLLARTLELVRAELAGRRPGVAEVSLVVLALGKLGGRELNYSSDVDLVLVRADGAEGHEAEALARAFVAAVQQGSAGGRLFRVDLRLRPYGGAGALVPRLSAVADYYQRAGRAWERQALLKARPVAGDLALGTELLQRHLAPFLWRERLEARAIGEIGRLRERMVEQAADAERDVKVGPGGIRDVEYAVQFLQLLHGGREPSLRTTSTVEAIERLRARHLRPAEADALIDAYELLRRLEHLLQLTVDREVTRLPRGEAAAPLARALGLDLAGLEEAFAAARRRARAVLDTLLRAPFPTAGGPAPEAHHEVQDLLLAEVDDAVAEPVLARYGFRDPAAAWRHLRDMVRERDLLLSPSGRARTTLAGLSPRLLEAIAARPDPDRTLRNLERATARLGAKATVYELMAEERDALHLLVSLAAGSDVLVDVLAAHPTVLDEVVDRLLTRTPITRDEIEEEVRAALEGPAALPALRELRALYLLLVGMPDLAERANVQNTSRALADLAEGFLRAAVGHATATVAAERGGAPPDGCLCVLAAGKLGGRELAYASDLDLVLVYEGSARTAGGLTPADFWGEVARRVIALGESPASVEGPLLPIDLRLRPGGRNAPLVVRRDAALAYYRGEGLGETARDFERLALQKARPVWGPVDRCRAFAEELQVALYERRYGAELWDELTLMRRRQVEAAAGETNLKRGQGSIADVELLASALALAHGRDHAELRQPNTAHLLDALEATGLLQPAEHRDLRTAYGFLRRVSLRVRVKTWAVRPTLPEGAELRDLARSLGYDDVGTAPAEEHFRRELAFHQERISVVFREVVARERR